VTSIARGVPYDSDGYHRHALPDLSQDPFAQYVKIKSREKQERGEDDSCGTRKNADDVDISSSEDQRSDCQEIRLGSVRQREIKKDRDDYEKDNCDDYEKDTVTKRPAPFLLEHGKDTFFTMSQAFLNAVNEQIASTKGMGVGASSLLCTGDQICSSSSGECFVSKSKQNSSSKSRCEEPNASLENISIISSKDKKSFSFKTTNGKYHDTQITGDLVSAVGYDEDTNPEEDKDDNNREDENKVIVAKILNGLSKNCQAASLQCANVAFSSEVLDELMIYKEHSKETYAQYYKDSFTGSIDESRGVWYSYSPDERDESFALRN